MLDQDIANKELADLSVVDNVDYLNNSMGLNIGDRKVKIVADFDNIAAIQRKTGKGEIALIMQFSRADFSITDIATILFNGIERSDTRFANVSELGNEILKSGKYNEFAAVAAGFLALAMHDGTEPGKLKGKAEAKAKA